VNVPSDGTERATYNGLMMVSLVPKTTSNALGTGYTVQTLSSVPLRQGPGSNFLTLSTASSGATGTVVEHDLNGIWAKGDNWWLIDVAGNEGWAPQSALQSLTAAGDVWKLY
jgi:hypothetical protein